MNWIKTASKKWLWTTWIDLIKSLAGSDHAEKKRKENRVWELILFHIYWSDSVFVQGLSQWFEVLQKYISMNSTFIRSNYLKIFLFLLIWHEMRRIKNVMFFNDGCNWFLICITINCTFSFHSAFRWYESGIQILVETVFISHHLTLSL